MFHAMVGAFGLALVSGLAWRVLAYLDDRQRERRVREVEAYLKVHPYSERWR